ncbi:MAG: ABC transporter ATP-binding protein [Deltaproteobacteria bacterium]|nr:ABC transporter ATP-binding protein [Deltaproteobacteria bacterium]
MFNHLATESDAIMQLVRTEKLSKIYLSGMVETVALKDVSISVKEGEFTSLVGPSGSGKTTLLNLIGGLDSPSSGDAFIGDMKITGMKKGELSDLRLRHIGFIFQEFNLIPVLSALENVEYVMLLQGISKKERRERSLEVLREVGLEGKENNRPGELSGGQQQRVAVARAVVSRPDIILADEPTANLDSETGEALMEMMLGLNEEHGITFLLSTHEKMVMDKSRRVIKLQDGKVVDDGR